MSVLGFATISHIGPKPTLHGGPEGKVSLHLDGEQLPSSIALMFDGPEHLSEWLEAACDGLSALLDPDPCGGGDLPDEALAEAKRTAPKPSCRPDYS